MPAIEKRQTISHGKSRTREYDAWAQMRQRCRDLNNPSFKNYGGRGIKVCERWANFPNFFEDMGEKPSPLHSLERLDNNGDYEPGNVIWGTALDQANNQRRVAKIDTPKGKLTVSQAARAFGLKRTTLRSRLYAGWPIEKAITV